MPMIRDVLASAAVTFASIDRLAVTLGPGTFTGVRTGIAAARAFRLAAGTEVVGLTSLAVIAARGFKALEADRNGRPILVALDARRGRLYVELFSSGPLDSLTGPAEIAPEDLAEFCSGKSCLAVGSAVARHEVVQAVAASPIVLCSHLADLEPDAADLAELAPKLSPLETISPIYIRPPDAKPPQSRAIARSTSS